MNISARTKAQFVKCYKDTADCIRNFSPSLNDFRTPFASFKVTLLSENATVRFFFQIRVSMSRNDVFPRKNRNRQ